MRRRWKRLLLLLPVTILCLGVIVLYWLNRDPGPTKPQPIPIGDYTYVRALAGQRIAQLMKQRHIPGAAVALIVDQQIIWQESFGLADHVHERAVTEDTIFKLWSLAKPFTALEMMRLVEEGLVDLDAPIDQYVPNLALQSRFPDGEPITIRHILAHRSGLPRNNCIYGNEWHMGSDAIERLADSLKNCFLTFPTGTRYKYSNVGYDALGYIIQERRGEIFPPYMVEQLLRPTGMSDSAFWSTDLPTASEIALGYEYYKGDYFPYEQFDIANIPSGNLYGTIGDLASFVRFIFRQGEANGEQLINPETLDMMFEDQYSRPADPQPMGLGWKIANVLESEKMVWHDGGPTEGIGSLVAMFPEKKMGVVLLANSTAFEGAVSVPLAAELLEAMLETEYGLVAVGEKPLDNSFPIEAATLEQYQGSYAAFEQIMQVSLNGDQLRGSIQGISFDLVPVAENRFKVSHWLLKLGLADLLNLPLDLRELELEFQNGAAAGQDVLVINLANFSYEICPRLPEPPESLAAGESLTGEYQRYARLPSGDAGRENLGQEEIRFVDDQLHMSGVIGPILPIDDNSIIILSGPFAGETITRDLQTGYLYHQGHVYKPVATLPA
jgi:CubicO group peptidase (beta-lactamase class C family)